MKIIRSIVSAVLCLCLFGCSAVSNKNSELQHKHTFSNIWICDETYHWHPSLCGHNVTSDKDKHSFGDWITAKEATGTTEGLRYKICLVCGYKFDETIEKPSHVHTAGNTIETNRVEPNCTEPGYYDLITYCSGCGEVMSRQHVSLSALGHDFVHRSGQNATCTEPGYSEYDVCKRCGLSTTKETIPATGHLFGAPTYTWSEDYTTCTATRICQRDSSHIESETVNSTYVVIQDATEDNTGLGRYTAVFENTAFSTQTYDKTIEKLSHVHTAGDSIQINRVEPDCTKEGSYDLVTYCSGCGEEMFRTHITIPALGHDFTHYSGKSATCTEAGYTEYDVCNRCGFSTKDDIPALGHLFGAPTYTWSEDHTTCTATRVCQHDNSHVETETVNSTYVVVKEATADDAGVGRYTAVFENTAFSTQTYDKTISATATFDKLVFEWTGSSYSVSAASTSIEGEVIIPSKYQGYRVTSIPDRGFAECSLITSISIPSSITSIGYRGLYSCSSLESIIVPNSVTSIADSAFYKCSSLNTITLPFVGGSASSNRFLGYIFGATSSSNATNFVPTSLKNVVLSSKCASIADEAFSGCSSVVSISLPTTITTVGNNAFNGCSSLTSMVIPDNVTSIGSYAFNGCSSLGSVYLSDRIHEIKTYTFNGCSSLASVIIPDSVTSIGNNAFSNCSSLASVIIPDSVTSIGKSTFQGCSRLLTITLPFVGGSVTSNQFLGYIFGASSSSTNATYVPKTLTSVVLSEKCTSIGANAFSDCASIASITISERVTSIGDNAFSNCYRLVEIINNSSLSIVAGQTDYGGVAQNALGVFAGPAESKITINDGLVLFSNNDDVWLINYIGTRGDVIIPDTVIGIIPRALFDCSTPTSIVVPDSVTSIGQYAFQGCSQLESITLPFVGGSATSDQFLGYIFGASSYTENADYIPTTLTSVVLTDKCASLGTGAFYNCRNISSIVLSKNITSIGDYAFCNCSSLKSIGIPDGVTSFGRSAFSGCSTLTSITIPSGVSLIRDYTFSNCSSLTSITIPNGITSIGSYAFNNCSGIKIIVVPDSVSSIGQGAFKDCSQLQSITLPFVGGSASSNRFLKYIFGASSYSDSGLIPSSLKTVVLSDQCDLVDEYAFYRCGTLSSVILSKNITSIGDYAFSGCSSLASITIPNSVTFIGNNAFYGCAAVSTITISENCESIGDYAFYNCSSLTSITIPDSVTSIGQNAFRNCSKLQSITLPFVGGSASSNQFLGYIFGATSYENNNTYIPTTLTTIVLSDKCTSLGIRAFYGCSKIISVILSKNTEFIGNYAFYGCSSLASITIPNSVTSIGDYAFYNCSSLTSITIPDSVTSIGQNAFHNCSSVTLITIIGGFGLIVGTDAFSGLSASFDYYGTIEKWLSIGGKKNLIGGVHLFVDGSEQETTSIVIPNSVTSIGEYAFYNCSSLTSITIPDSVTSIGQNAFYYCSSISSIVVPDSVTSIGRSAFYYCSQLQSITLPFVGGSASSNQFLGYIFGATSYENNKTFISTTALTTVVLSDKCTSLGIGAFYNCSSLTSITIPDSVSSFGGSTFRGCSSLTSIVIPNGVISLGGNTFYNCSSLTSIVIPNSVTSIGEYAFYNCSSLASITIPSGVTFLAQRVFCNCSSLASITIPDSVTSIGNYAFSGCSSLASITIPDGVTSIGSGAFQQCSNLASITLPFVGGSASSNQFLGYIFGASSYSYNSSYVPTSLGTIVLTNKCTSLASNAFYGCSSFNFHYHGTLEKWLSFEGKNNLNGKVHLFLDDSGLETTSIIIPDSVTSLDQYAFYRCSYLTSITLPFVGGSATTNRFIGYIFGASSYSNNYSYVPSLLTVVLSDKCTSIGDNAFYGCSSIKINYHGTLEKWLSFEGKKGFNGSIHLFLDDSGLETTSIIIPTSVTSLDQNAFYRCSSLVSITLPNSVTSIGNYAFPDSSSLNINYHGTLEKWLSIEGKKNFDGSIHLFLDGSEEEATSIIIPDSVTSLDQYAFYRCSSLVSVTLPNTLTSIGNDAFFYCSSLASITIPNSVTSIGSYAFYYCSSLASIAIPDSITTIRYQTFYNCSSLSSVVILGNLTSIDSDAFARCSSLTSITLPNTLTSIGSYAFSYCSSLTSITLPNTLTSIGSYAFNNCSALTEINIPNSLASIGSYVFQGCSALKSITIGNGVTSIGEHAFAYCSALESITLPNTLTSIGDYAFYNCSSLTSINIPNSITKIGNSAFRCCSSLTSIVIPSSVTSIGNYAFRDCPSLTIYCEAASKPSGWSSSWNYSNCEVVWDYHE